MRLFLPRMAPVAGTVRDLQGRVVRRLFLEDAFFPAGSSTVAWDGVTEQGRRAPAGLYFVQITVASRRLERRIVLFE